MQLPLESGSHQNGVVHRGAQLHAADDSGCDEGSGRSGEIGEALIQEELQSGKSRKEAIRIAADSADSSIITSALVLFCATLGVSFVSSIDLIGAICIMLARGALISACICLFVMPAVLYVCEPVFSKTTLHWRTPAPKKESKTAKALKAASEKLPVRKEKAALPEKGTEQTETTEPAEAADSTKLAAESETEADAARETANV